MKRSDRVFREADRLVKAGRTGELCDLLNSSIAADPGLPDTWMKDAMELGYAGKYGEAEDYLLILFIIRNGDLSIMHIRSINCWLSGECRRAVALCEEIIGKDPGFGPAYTILGCAQYDLGKYGEALESLDRAVELRRGESMPLCVRGMALAALGRKEEAAQAFGGVVAMDPGFAGGQLTYARHWDSLGLYRESLLCLEMALAVDPGLGGAWLLKGNALALTGRCREALESIEMAEKCGSGTASVLLLRSLALHLLGENDWALACLDRLVKEEPGNASAISARGGLLLEMGRFEEARQCFDRGVELGMEGGPGLLGSLGKCYEAVGRPLEASLCKGMAAEASPKKKRGARGKQAGGPKGGKRS